MQNYKDLFSIPSQFFFLLLYEISRKFTRMNSSVTHLNSHVEEIGGN